MVKKPQPKSEPAGMMRAAVFAWVAAVAVLVIYYSTIPPAGVVTEMGATYPAQEFYNLMVAGFRQGQLDLPLPVPEKLRALADPYDPRQSAPFRGAMYSPGRLHDLTYFGGKLYMYFSAVPALVLFWPWVAVTGSYLPQTAAIFLFAALGLVLGTGLLLELRRAFFPQVSALATAGGVIAFGLAGGVMALFRRPEVYEVAISCAYALTMAALFGLWRALAQQDRRVRWLVFAGFCYSLAIATRPALAFGAIVFLVPLLSESQHERKDRHPLLAEWREWLGALLPAISVGVVVAWFNNARFGSALEFGQRYQLAGASATEAHLFSLNYLWTNFRVYFLTPVEISREFPFFGQIQIPPLPPGHGGVFFAYGILVNCPVALYSFATFSLFQKRSPVEHKLLRVVGVVAALFSINALTLLLFCGACSRYQVEFQPVLMLLAVIGFWRLEQARYAKKGRAFAWNRPVFGALLAYSACFSVLKDATVYADSLTSIAVQWARRNSLSQARDLLEQALKLRPRHPDAHAALGALLARAGDDRAALSHLEQAIKLRPEFAEAHYNLAQVMGRDPRRLHEAIEHAQMAVRLEPKMGRYRAGLNSLREKAPSGREAAGSLDLAPAEPMELTTGR